MLAGPDERSDLLLSLARSSSATTRRSRRRATINLFDGTENDEILTLRTLALTDAEKAEARATDPRAAGIIDAVDALPPEIMERLHGAIRSLRGRPAKPTTASRRSSPRPVRLAGDRAAGVDAVVGPGRGHVGGPGDRLGAGRGLRRRPGQRASCCAPAAATDAQDRFLAGMRATVQAVVHDVDGEVHVAVSVDERPGRRSCSSRTGRFRYFRPDELEPVS